MFTRSIYCAICGGPFNLPALRNPEHPDPNEDPMLPLADPYDSRLLARQLTEWLLSFHIVGRWKIAPASLRNESTNPSLFVSELAKWSYNADPLGPTLPTTDGGREGILVYEPVDDEDGMLFPIHSVCLSLMEHFCTSSLASSTSTTLGVCDALHRRRRANGQAVQKIRESNGYYGRSGGIEWDHAYFGARQFWSDPWDTEEGWEFLCADPSAGKIPELAGYVVSKMPKLEGLTQDAAKARECVEGTGWLFPEEVDEIVQRGDGCLDWETGHQILQEEADRVGRMDDDSDGGEDLTDVPIGLRNRWRLLKILRQIELT